MITIKICQKNSCNHNMNFNDIDNNNNESQNSVAFDHYKTDNINSSDLNNYYNIKFSNGRFNYNNDNDSSNCNNCIDK